MTVTRIKSEFTRLIDPIRACSPKAFLYPTIAMAFMLVYLHQGQSGFFIKHLASWLLVRPTDSDLEWWAVMYQFAFAFVWFFLVPVVLLKYVVREKLVDLGLGLGDWKFGILVVLFGWVLISLPGGLGAGLMPDFCSQYPLAKSATDNGLVFLKYQLAYGLMYYVAWEGFFRGFLQLGLRKHLGDLGAMLFQTSASTLLHIGKPQAEIWAALAAGFIFGLVVLRCRSIWPLVLVHWGLGLVTDISCAVASGRWL